MAAKSDDIKGRARFRRDADGNRGMHAVANEKIREGMLIMKEKPTAAVCNLSLANNVQESTTDMELDLTTGELKQERTTVLDEVTSWFLDGMDAWEPDLPTDSMDWHLVCALLRKGKRRDWAKKFIHHVKPEYRLLPQSRLLESDIRKRYPEVTGDDVWDIYGAIRHNAFTMSSLLLGHEYGTGFYPKTAILNHSCDPNCAYTFEHRTLMLYATRTIEEGEELCHAYCGFNVCLDAKPMRQKFIHDRLGFWCHCKRCELPREPGAEKRQEALFPAAIRNNKDPDKKPHVWLKGIMEAAHGKDYRRVVEIGDLILDNHGHTLTDFPLSGYGVLAAYVQAHWLGKDPRSDGPLDGRHRALGADLLMDCVAKCRYLTGNEAAFRSMEIFAGAMLQVFAEEDGLRPTIGLLASFHQVDTFFGGFDCLKADVLLGGSGIQELIDKYKTVRPLVDFTPTQFEKGFLTGATCKEQVEEALKQAKKFREEEKAFEERKRIRMEQRKLEDARHARLEEEMKKEDGPRMSAEEEKAHGNVAYKERRFDDALNHYTRAIKLNPNEMTFWLNKAAVYMEKEEYEHCAMCAEEAAELGVEFDAPKKLIAKAYARAANAHVKMGQYEQALEHFGDSLKFHESAEVLLISNQIEDKWHKSRPTTKDREAAKKIHEYMTR